ncbi:MAG: hypothetical protein ACSNEK_03955 [Parachlamydiaceae bacterium]
MASPIRPISSPPLVCHNGWQGSQKPRRAESAPIAIPRPVVTPGNPLPRSLTGRVAYTPCTPSGRVIPGHRNG